MPTRSNFTRNRLGNIVSLVYKNIPLRLCIIEPLGGATNALNQNASDAAIIARESVLSTRITSTWAVDGAFDIPDNRWELPILTFNLSASIAPIDYMQLFLLAGGSPNPPKTFFTSAINTSTNAITVPQHGLTTGDRVIITANGTLPAPLDSDTQPFIYLALVTDTNNFKLARPSAPTTEIDLTNTGTGTFTLKYANGTVDRILDNLAEDNTSFLLTTIPVNSQPIPYEIQIALAQT